MKASFANPNNLLIPGMYATIVSDAELAQGSILVPTKALIQLLNKDMLDVIVDGKVQQKAVKVGATYGLYTIIESGIDVTDEVIVEGQNKVQIGQAVEAVETTREEMENPRPRLLQISMVLRSKEGTWLSFYQSSYLCNCFGARYFYRRYALYFTLPVDRYPKITPPQVSVRATYPGADSEVVAQQ